MKVIIGICFLLLCFAFQKDAAKKTAAESDNLKGKVKQVKEESYDAKDSSYRSEERRVGKECRL